MLPAESQPNPLMLDQDLMDETGLQMQGFSNPMKLNGQGGEGNGGGGGTGGGQRRRRSSAPAFEPPPPAPIPRSELVPAPIPRSELVVAAAQHDGDVESPMSVEQHIRVDRELKLVKLENQEMKRGLTSVKLENKEMKRGLTSVTHENQVMKRQMQEIQRQFAALQILVKDSVNSSAAVIADHQSSTAQQKIYIDEASNKPYRIDEHGQSQWMDDNEE